LRYFKALLGLFDARVAVFGQKMTEKHIKPLFFMGV